MVVHGPQKYRKRLAALSLAAAASFALAWGATKETPDGREVMMQMADFLSKTPGWNVTLHTAYDTVQQDGSKIEWDDVRTVTLRRPDRLRVESQRSDGARLLVVFNGKEITTFDQDAKVYAQAFHPGSVDDAVIYFVHDLRIQLPLAVMLLERLPAELQHRVQSVEYVEDNVTLGVPARHIAGKTATVDFQLWIAKGDQPLPLRAVLTYKDAPGQPQFRAQFSDWKVDVKAPDSLFTFTPPSGVNKIPFAATLSGVSATGKGPAAPAGGKP